MVIAEMKEKVGCCNSAWSKQRFPDTPVHALLVLKFKRQYQGQICTHKNDF